MKPKNISLTKFRHSTYKIEFGLFTYNNTIYNMPKYMECQHVMITHMPYLFFALIAEIGEVRITATELLHIMCRYAYKVSSKPS